MTRAATEAALRLSGRQGWSKMGGRRGDGRYVRPRAIGDRAYDWFGIE